MTRVIGKRVEPNDDGRLYLRECEYGKQANGIWYARPPGSHVGSLEEHDVVEHEDGTITVSPSILIQGGDGDWHGYLRKGVWESV